MASSSSSSSSSSSCHLHPKHPEWGSYVLVTVGSTQFDGLVSAASEVEFGRLVQTLGFDAIVFQIGTGAWIPPQARLENEVDRRKEDWAPRERIYYRHKPDLSLDLAHASLVISHAGAATTIESLLAKRNLVVVTNDSLMDNHQAELAEEMSKQGYLWHCPNPRQLHELLSKTYIAHETSSSSPSLPSPKQPLKPWPNTIDAPNTLFDNYLSTKVYPSTSSSTSSSPSKTLVVLGSGGHTGEMFRLIRSIDRTKFSPLLYCHASNDPMSAQKAVTFETSSSSSPSSPSSSFSSLPLRPEEFLFSVPRARKVHQSYFTSIFTTLWALICSIVIVLKAKPQVVITNGPGTCVPILFLVTIFRKLGILDRTCQTIYVESIARVHSLSFSGKLLKSFVDHFLVQWPYLAETYPQALYIGLLV